MSALFRQAHHAPLWLLHILHCVAGIPQGASVIDHVHSRAECDGAGLIYYIDPMGTPRTWLVSASRCPLRPDSEDTLRAHLARCMPESVFVKAEIFPPDGSRARVEKE